MSLSRTLAYLLSCIALFAAIGCSGGGSASDEDFDVSSDAVTQCGFTTDFRAFLTSHGYGSFDFARGDLEGCSSYGGRERHDESLVNDPVIFVHGNSDRGLGGNMGGYRESLEAFRSAGYRSRELYTFTWGNGNAMEASFQYHSRAHLERVRAFIEAVLAYTGATKIDVIGHSMGVTLARKAIVGGAANDALAGGAYDLGPSLSARIDTFVGIAGANLGLGSCWVTGPTTPTCGSTNGFYPGTLTMSGTVVGRSSFLTGLLGKPHCEGGHVYSIWSSGDPIAGSGAALVWGKVTARIPGQDGEVEVPSSYGHLGAKSKTGPIQVHLVRDHVLPEG